MVDDVRRWLETETQMLRTHVRDVEMWVAHIQLDAALVNEVEAAEELLRFWQRQWNEHVELCRLFSAVAGRLYNAERMKVRELVGIKV